MERLISLIANFLDLQSEDVKSDTELRDLSEDSLERVELLMFLEEEFQTEIDEEDIDKIITVRQLYDYLTNNGQLQCEVKS